MGSSQASLKEYKYKDRRVPYRSEKLEPSQKELDTIKRLVNESAQKSGEFTVKQKKKSRSKGPVKIIFDTDIGTDIDDSLALLAALHTSPEELQILAITTAYGWTNIRAAVTQKILDAHFGDKEKPQVIAGAGVPLGTHREVWHTGTEGCGSLETDEILRLRDESNKITKTTDDAAKSIVDIVNKTPGEVVILALGALTNVARAIQLGGDEFKKNVKRIVYMGQGHRVREKDATLPEHFKGSEEPYTLGGAYPHYPNHNLSCDTLASMITFESGIPLTMVNDAVTNKMWFNGEECLRLVEATSPPQCREVGKLLRVWLTYRSMIFFKAVRGTCPHDALTLSEAIHPSRFCKFVRGHVIVHEWAAFTTFIPDPDGPHAIGDSIDAEGFLEWLRPLLAPKDMETAYTQERGTILDMSEEDQMIELKKRLLK